MKPSVSPDGEQRVQIDTNGFDILRAGVIDWLLHPWKLAAIRLVQGRHRISNGWIGCGN